MLSILMEELLLLSISLSHSTRQSSMLKEMILIYRKIIDRVEEITVYLFRETERISMVFIMGDPGSYYESTYYNDDYVERNMTHLGGMKALNCWKAKIDE